MSQETTMTTITSLTELDAVEGGRRHCITIEAQCVGKTLPLVGCVGLKIQGVKICWNT